MAKDLRLEVVLGAIDKATGPLKKIRQGSGKTAEAMRATRDQLKELNKQQKDVTAYRKANAAMRSTSRRLRDLGLKHDDYNRRLDEQREAHVRIKSNLATARREYDKLAKQVGEATEPSRQLTAQLEKSRIRLTSMQQAFDQSSRSIKKYKDRTRHLDDQVKGLRRTQERHQDTLRDVGRRLDDAGIKKDEASRAARELRLREERLNDTLEQQQRHLKRVAEKQKRLGQLRERHGKEMMRVGMLGGGGVAAMAVGQRGVAAAGRLINPGIDWEAQMDTLAAVGRFQEDDPRLRGLMEQSRGLGGSTAFSATQVGAGQEFLLRAGMSAEAIQTSMRDVLDLALANNIELARAADISSNIASGFRIDPNVEGNMSRVADVLTATASRANVDMEMLGDTMKYLGAGSGLGLGLEQAAAMAGLLGNIGIQGSQAGTTLRTMMNRLSNPVGKANDSIEALDLQVTDAEGNLRQIPEILRDISSATEGMGNAQQAAHLQNIFGTEAGSGMAELVRQQGSAGIDELIQSITDAQGQNARAAGTMADNVAGDLKNLRSAWEEVGISIADTNNGPLRELIQSLTDITRRAGDWIKQNPETVAMLAKVGAAILGAALVLGGLATAVASILGPMLIMRFLVTRTATSLFGLGLQAADGTRKAGLLSRTLSGLGKLLKGPLWKGLKGVGSMLLWGGKQLFGFLQGLRALGAILWAVGKGLLVGLLGALKAVALFLATNPIGWAIMAIAGASFLIIKYWEPLKAFFSGLWKSLEKKAGEFWEWLEGVGPEAGRAVRDFFLNWTLPGLLVNHWDDIKANGRELWEWFENAPSNAIEAVKTMLADWDLKGAMKEKWDEGIEYLKNLPGSMKDAGIDAAKGLGNGIRNGAGNAWNAVRGLAGGTEQAARYELDTHSPSKVFARIGRDVTDGLALGIRRQQDNPVRETLGMVKRLRRAGAGLALGAAASVAVAGQPGSEGGIAIDHRPPMAAPSGGGLVIEGGINIEVNAAPGMDEQALARRVADEVQRALAEAEHRAAARRRSAFYDID